MGVAYWSKELGNHGPKTGVSRYLDIRCGRAMRSKRISENFSRTDFRVHEQWSETIFFLGFVCDFLRLDLL